MATKEISISEASKRYGQPVPTIRFWIRKKKLPAVKKTIGSSKVAQYRIKVDAIEKVLKGMGLSTQPAKSTASLPRVSVPANSSISSKLFDFARRHPETFGSMTMNEIEELAKELES